MSIRFARDVGPIPLRAVRWIARAASLASIGMLGLFSTSGGAAPTPFEMLLLACFPLGVSVGMGLAWFREISGGLVTLSSLVGFHLLLALAGDRPPSGPWFPIFASPGLLLLAVGMATRRWARTRASHPSR